MKSMTAFAALIGVAFAAVSASSAFAQSSAPGSTPSRPNKVTAVPPPPPPPGGPDKLTTRTQPPRPQIGLRKLPEPKPIGDFAGTDPRADAGRRAADAIFAETETMLARVPREQAMWARAFATSRASRASTAEISAAIAAAFPEASPDQKIKIHLILLTIMMGDIVGALRSYAVLHDRDMRQFTRLIVDKLNAIQNARSTVIRNFARSLPPRAYAGNDPSGAQRAQDKTARYTQFVQMSTQLMNELQSTERELVDALQSQHRSMTQFWEFYAGFRDREFRRSHRVMTTR